jgi:hypothetical protein
MEGKFILIFQVEGAQISTPPMNNIEGPNKSTNNNIPTFRHFITGRFKLNPKKKVGQEVDDFLL